MKKKKGNVLELGNSLSFEPIKDLKTQFDSLLKNEDNITLQADMISEIDLTGIQFIQYCLLKAETLKKTLNFDLSLEDEPRKILEKNGFFQLIERAFS